MMLSLNTPYEEPGYIAFDDVDGLITDKVWFDTDLDVNRSEKYRILYNVKDAAGNWAVSVIRTIIVQNDAKPLVKTYQGQYSSENSESGSYEMTLRVSPTENNKVFFSSFGNAPTSERVDVVGHVVGDSILVDLQYIEGVWYAGTGMISEDKINFESQTGTDQLQLLTSQVEYVPI